MNDEVPEIQEPQKLRRDCGGVDTHERYTVMLR
jgi:hypothetical protein